MTQVLIPRWIHRAPESYWHEGVSLAGGVILVAALAQLAIPLPWTPVPITGQTFGVVLLALLWGGKRSAAAMTAYLALGLAGVPLFAAASGGPTLGPTSGYLAGMWLAAIVMGALADRGHARKFVPALAVAFLGTSIIFASGVLGLSYFVPATSLLDAGVLPFIPGAIIKNLLAAGLAAALNNNANLV